MDCNREEAVRARDLAEKKMQVKDFTAALRLVLKAQQLQANLENITQMLIVCEVHCAAEKKLFGNEKDWYNILQIQTTADEVAIKKQYKKLALQLHPDKNKVPGAEAAFKLIGEAQSLLLDKTKRMFHDEKRKRGLNNKKPVQHQHQYPPRSNYSNGSSGVRFNFSSNPQVSQAGRAANVNNPLGDRPMFWTMCPFCTARHHYSIEIINKYVQCDVCKKCFMAFQFVQETSAPTNMFRAANLPLNKMESGSQNGTSQMDGWPFKGNLTEKRNHEDSSRDCKMESGNKQEFKPKTEECVDNVYVNVKRRKHEDSSSSQSVEYKSCESEDEVETENDGDFEANIKVESGDRPRRSSRSKQQVSYKETRSDEESEDSTSSSDDVSTGVDLNVEPKTAETSDNANSCANDLTEENDDESNQKASRAGGDIPLDSRSNDPSSPKEFIVPDPEFNDFETSRNESCFAHGQIWALYDEYDAMPRIYARIIEVLNPSFKLRIRWLEPYFDDEDEKEWIEEEEDSPISCGTFHYGKSEITQDLSSFSHLVRWEQGFRKKFFKIFPCKDEVWAIYKSNKENGKPVKSSNVQFEYEFVKVLSDYSESNGVDVSFLTKVLGFVSLFSGGLGKVHFYPVDVRRFSHKVPSFVMTGEEKVGVPQGSFELDPSSLPETIIGTTST